MKMRALDNVGAYAGPLAVPARQADRRHRRALPHQQRASISAIAVVSNKTVQEAVRAFGQSPTNFAIERAIEEVARHRRLDRLEVRRRNLIRAEEFPYLIPSGTTYDSGDYHAVIDKVLARADYAALAAERDRLRAGGLLAGIGIAACLRAKQHQLDLRAAALSEERNHHLFQLLPGHRRSQRRRHRHHPYAVRRAGTRSAGRRGVGEVLELDPDRIRVVRTNWLTSLPSQSPVGSRMAIMLGGAAFHAAHKLKARARRDCRA